MDRLTDEEVKALEARYVPNGDLYLLWAARDMLGVHITRGRTQAEAEEYIAPIATGPMTSEHVLPIDSGWRYGINHAPGWMERPPIWLLRRMFNV